jgi:hypothetical protein
MGKLRTAVPIKYLFRDAVFSQFVQFPYLVPLLTKLNQNSFGKKLLNPIFNRFVFPKFCSGETFEECTKVSKSIWIDYGVFSIIDEASEDFVTEKQFDFCVQQKIEMLENIQKDIDLQVRFIPIKCTGLISSSLLQEISQLIDENSEDYEADVLLIVNRLVPEKQQEFSRALSRFQSLCKHLQQINLQTKREMSFLLDAEQSHLQAAVELIYRLLASEFNLADYSYPLVYNTYQTYLSRTPKILAKDAAYCHRHQSRFAVKLVRGAYLQFEQQRSSSQLPTSTSSTSPLQAKKQLVDECYNGIARDLVQQIVSYYQSSATTTAVEIRESISHSHHSEKKTTYSTSQLAPFVIFATHNRHSVEFILLLLEQHRTSFSSSASKSSSTTESSFTPIYQHIHFAQILGISDLLTYESLSNSPVAVSKLLLYGKADELRPWLIRRLHENRESLGAMMTAERQATWNALKQRVWKIL